MESLCGDSMEAIYLAMLAFLIFAFPAQQMVMYWGLGQNWSWGLHFGLSVVVTFLLAYTSWYLIERRALRHKPKTGSPLKAHAA